MKFASFDLELYTLIPEGEKDWWAHAPLEIACVGTARGDDNGVLINTILLHPVGFSGCISQPVAQDVVRHLQGLVRKGYTIVTWNGASFDFRVLAEASLLHDECVELALNHWDMMLQVTVIAGHWLGLQKALCGASLPGKLEVVELSTGEKYYGMDGAAAPSLWQDGEYNAVLQYQEVDVQQELALAYEIHKHQIVWYCSTCGIRKILLGEPATVQDCLNMPERTPPHWVTNPPNKFEMVEWMGVERE